MVTRSKITLFAVVALSSSMCVFAQSPNQTQAPKPTDETAPSAASSPHQREATKSKAQEAPAANGAEPTAASSPHQQQALKKCMTDQQAKNANATPDAVKKTCAEQLKANEDRASKKKE